MKEMILNNFFETQKQQRENANQWRAAIVFEMWSDVLHIDNTEH